MTHMSESSLQGGVPMLTTPSAISETEKQAADYADDMVSRLGHVTIEGKVVIPAHILHEIVSVSYLVGSARGQEEAWTKASSYLIAKAVGQ